MQEIKFKGLCASLVILLVGACEDDATAERDAGAHEHEQAHDGGHKPDSGEPPDAGKPTGDAGVDAGERHAGAGGRGGGGGASEFAGTGGAGGSQADAGGAGGTGAGSGQAPNVTIKFKAKVGEQDFSCGKSFTNQGNKASTVSAQDMRLFIQDLALIKADKTRVPVKLEVRAPWQSETVALLDFENQTGNCLDGTRGTNSELTGYVEPGDYTGVSFVNGVPEDLNHAEPSTLKDPLATSVRLQWSWQAGFRFAKIELVNAVPGENDLGRAFFHPGATACTGNPAQGNVTCAKPNRTEVVFEDFDAEDDTIVIDVAELFKNVDLEQPNECHSTPQNVCDPMFNAWGLNWANGGQKAGQTVFKLE